MVVCWHVVCSHLLFGEAPDVCQPLVLPAGLPANTAACAPLLPVVLPSLPLPLLPLWTLLRLESVPLDRLLVRALVCVVALAAALSRCLFCTGHSIGGSTLGAGVCIAITDHVILVVVCCTLGGGGVCWVVA